MARIIISVGSSTFLGSSLIRMSFGSPPKPFLSGLRSLCTCCCCCCFAESLCCCKIRSLSISRLSLSRRSFSLLSRSRSLSLSRSFSCLNFSSFSLSFCRSRSLSSLSLLCRSRSLCSRSRSLSRFSSANRLASAMAASIVGSGFKGHPGGAPPTPLAIDVGGKEPTLLGIVLLHASWTDRGAPIGISLGNGGRGP